MVQNAPRGASSMLAAPAEHGSSLDMSMSQAQGICMPDLGMIKCQFKLITQV
jgi:hypothetical protein